MSHDDVSSLTNRQIKEFIGRNELKPGTYILKVRCCGHLHSITCNVLMDKRFGQSVLKFGKIGLNNHPTKTRSQKNMMRALEALGDDAPFCIKIMRKIKKNMAKSIIYSGLPSAKNIPYPPSFRRLTSSSIFYRSLKKREANKRDPLAIPLKERFSSYFMNLLREEVLKSPRYADLHGKKLKATSYDSFDKSVVSTDLTYNEVNLFGALDFSWFKLWKRKTLVIDGYILLRFDDLFPEGEECLNISDEYRCATILKRNSYNRYLPHHCHVSKDMTRIKI